MSGIKERLLGAITVMDDASAMKLWDFILEQFDNGWDAIEEVEPDSIDLQMIQEVENNPECLEFT